MQEKSRRSARRAMLGLVLGAFLALIVSPAASAASLLAMESPEAGATTNAKPTFSGSSSDTVDPVTVVIHEGASTAGLVVESLKSSPSSEGRWSAPVTSPLVAGTYTAVAEQTEFENLGGVLGETLTSQPPVTFTVVTEAPKVTIEQPLTPSNQREPSFSGTASEDTNVTVHVFLGAKEVAKATTKAASGAWSVTSPELSEGKHAFTAYATEESGLGNGTGTSAPVGFEVDTLSPVVTLAQPSSPTSKTEPPFSGTASENTEVVVHVLEGSTEVASAKTTAAGGKWSTSTLSKPLPPGRHTYKAYATEKSSLENPDGRSEELPFEVDTEAPTVTLVGPPSPSKNTKPSFSGTASEETEVVVHVLNEASVEVAKASTKAAAGSWSLEATVPSGKHAFTAYATEKSGLGNGDGESATVEFEVNTNPPEVALDALARSKNTTPSFSGTASEVGPAVTVEIYKGTKAEGTPVATATAAGSRVGESWTSASASPALEAGDHTFTAVALEPSGLGNTEGRSAEVHFEVDTQPPEVTISQPASPSKNTEPSFSGTASEATEVTVHVFEGPTEVASAKTTAAGGKWSTSAASLSKELPKGKNTFTANATAKSAIGNEQGESATVEFEVNTNPPIVTINQPKTPSNVTKPSFDGTASEATEVVVHVFLGAEEVASAKTTASGGSWSTSGGSLSKELPKGKNTFTAYATEVSGLGNGPGESAKATFEVNTQAPEVTISQPPSPSKNTEPSFSGTASEATEVTVHVLEGATEVASAKTTAAGGKWSTEGLSKPLSEGKHTFTAYATEKSGLKNAEGESTKVTFEVNTQAPLVTIAQPASPSKNTEPSFSGTASEATEVTVHVLEGATEVASAKTTASGGKWSTNAGSLSKELSSGKHVFTAYATEKSGLGNGSGESAKVEFEVDTEPPEVVLDAVARSKNTAPSFKGTASEKGPTVTVDIYKGSKVEGTPVASATAAGSRVGESWTSASASPALEAGDHTFTAVALEPSGLGNAEGRSAEVHFEVDTEPPEVTISQPPSPSKNTEPSFSGTASEATEVTVHVLEGAKQVASAKTTASGGKWSTSSLSKTLQSGVHTFTAYATEKSGLENKEGESAKVTFEVNTEPPEVKLNALARSKDTAPSFSGTASETGPAVTVDVYEGKNAEGTVIATATAAGGRAGTSWSSSQVSTTLPSGNRTFTAVAVEESGLGNAAGKSAEVHFEVDTQPPEVTIEQPPSPSSNTKPSFSGTASEATEVVVHVFEGSKEVASTKTTASAGKWSTNALSEALPGGEHTFTAYATEKSAIGNENGTSSPVVFAVDTKPPAVTLEAVVRSKDRTPSFKGTASEKGPAVTVEIYKGAKAEGTPVASATAAGNRAGENWTSGGASPQLESGENTFTAVAVEQSGIGAGEGTSAPVVFEVDTEPPAVTIEQPQSPSNKTSPIFSGTASEAGEVVVHVLEAGKQVATGAGEVKEGKWSAGVIPALKSGKNKFTAYATEKSGLGNGPGESAKVEFEVNTNPPVVTINQPASLSKNTAPSFSGTASEATEVVVHVFKGAEEVASAKTTASGGAWSTTAATLSNELPQGKNKFTAYATEKSGLGNGPGESAKVEFEVNTNPPEVVLNAPARSKNVTPSFKGTASEVGPAVTVDIYKGSKAEGTPVATATAAGSRTGEAWTSGSASPALEAGDHTFTAVALEPSGLGNAEGKSAEVHFEVDTLPPEVKLNPVALSNDTTPSFSGTASEAGPAVTVDIYKGTKVEGTPVATATAVGGRAGMSWTSGDASPALLSGDREYTAVAVESSGIGNAEGKSGAVTFEVDTEPPEVTLNAVARSKNTTPSFTGTASEVGPAVTVDVYKGSKAEGTPVATVTAAGSRPGATWGSGSASPPLESGNNTFTAVAVEPSGLGNAEGKSAEVHFEVDTLPPVVTLHALETPSNNTKPAFFGTASEETEVVVHVVYQEGSKEEEAKAAVKAAGGTWSVPVTLPTGKHVFKAYATEKSGIGNLEGRSEERTFEVNTEPPVVTMEPLAEVSPQNKPEFSGTASEGGEVAVEIFRGAKAEGSPVQTLGASVASGKWHTPHLTEALKDGQYVAIASQPSSLGNAPGKSSEVKFEIDTKAPLVTIEHLPSPSKETDPAFKGEVSNNPGKTVTLHIYKGATQVAQEEVSVQSGKWASKRISLEGGYNTYWAQATAKSELSGNAEGKSAMMTFVIDTEPPAVTLNPLPARSNDATPSFGGTTNEAGEVKVAVYKGGTVGTEPPLVTVTGAAAVGTWATEAGALVKAVKGGRLEDGQYTAIATQESEIGNGQGKSAEVHFEIDTKSPTVTLKPLPALSSDRRPAFSGTASEGEPVTLEIYEGATHTGKPVRSIAAIVSEGVWSSGRLEESEQLEWGKEYTAVATEPSAVCAKSGKECNEPGHSAPVTFEIKQIPPEVRTEAAREVTESTAALYGSVNPLGGQISECYIEVGQTIGSGRHLGCGLVSEESSFPEASTAYVPVYIRIYGLSASTLYHYRVVANGEGGISYGADATFTTPAEEGFGPVAQHVTPPAKSPSPPGQPKAETAAFFAHQLAPTGKAATIRALLKSGMYKLKVQAPEAGTVAIKWYYLPPGAELARAKSARAEQAAKRKPQPVLVASGELTFHAAETATLKVRLSPAGRTLLRHSQQIRLTATCAFTPAGGTSTTTSKTFELKH